MVQNDIYVDDCMSGYDSITSCHQLADELTLVLSRGGFNWYPEVVQIRLDVKDLHFAKKYRGKRSKISSMVPEKLTKRHSVSQVAEIFDLVGKITPLTAHLKLDLHGLVKYKLGWDDAIPDELRPCWISHFDMIKEISNISFNRAIIPDDVVSLEMETIDCGDASMQMACAAIYMPDSNGRILVIPVS